MKSDLKRTVKKLSHQPKSTCLSISFCELLEAVLTICSLKKTLLWQVTYATFHSISCSVFSFLPLGLALITMSQCFCVHVCLCIVMESYPRLSLSVSLGKVFGTAVRCLNVQWTSLTPGQLQLRGQDGMACMGEIYREERRYAGRKGR